MAFLSSSSRFSPDLDKPRKIQPNPSTYEPHHVTVAKGPALRSTSRYGTIGPHHDNTLHRIASSSPAALALAAAEPAPASSPHSIRRKSPAPWDYTPTLSGQFERIFTVDDLESQRKRHLLEAKRTAATRLANGPLAKEKPPEVQHLELGPGNYELDKDWNLEPVSVPFSFGKEQRRGILDCIVAERDLRSHDHRLNKYSKRLTTDQRRRSESALLPLRRVAASSGGVFTSSIASNEPVVSVSKELARSYAELQRSSSRLERKMTSHEARSVQFQRFNEIGGEIESFRRGPGSYFDANADNNGHKDVPTTLPLDDQQRQELEALLATDAPPVDAKYRKKKTSFGLVKHRDMLSSMARAGHLSAVAVEDAVGPGVYETSKTLDVPTHNMLYKNGANIKGKHKKTIKPKLKSDDASTESNSIDEKTEAEAREQWLTLRHGPQWKRSLTPSTTVTNR